MWKVFLWGSIGTFITLTPPNVHGMEQRYFDESFWTRNYQEIKALNDDAVFRKQIESLAARIDPIHPYGGEAGHHIFVAWSDKIIKPSLTYFLKTVQELNAAIPLTSFLSFSET